jgi:hypothetical protein
MRGLVPRIHALLSSREHVGRISVSVIRRKHRGGGLRLRLIRSTICGGTDLPVVSSPLAKNISLFRLVETAIEQVPSRAHQEGRYASSRTWSAGCDGREVAPQDERGYPRTAKPRGSGASTLASSSWINSRTTVARKPDHREERGVSRKTIAQGMPECFGQPVVTMLVCFHFSHARLRVRMKHPAFPAPSVFSRAKFDKARADRAAGRGGASCACRGAAKRRLEASS